MKGGPGTLFKIKRLVCITLFISALMFPASAFASTGTSSVDSKSRNQSFNQFLSYFVGNKEDKNLNYFWGNDSNDKNHCPTDDSYNIWKKWYCN
jgi:hypothetical protein